MPPTNHELRTRILVLLRDEPDLTARQVAERVEITPSYARRLLRTMGLQAQPAKTGPAPKRAIDLARRDR